MRTTVRTTNFKPVMGADPTSTLTMPDTAKPMGQNGGQGRKRAARVGGQVNPDTRRALLFRRSAQMRLPGYRRGYL